MVLPMADDDQDRTRGREAEREAEIEPEMKRIDQDPNQVDEGSENLGAQNAGIGSPRDEENEE